MKLCASTALDVSAKARIANAVAISVLVFLITVVPPMKIVKLVGTMNRSERRPSDLSLKCKTLVRTLMPRGNFASRSSAGVVVTRDAH